MNQDESARRNSEIELERSAQQPTYDQPIVNAFQDSSSQPLQPSFPDELIQKQEKTKLIKKKTQRILVIILDIVAILAFIIYCIFIQSYYSTFYLLSLILLLNYSYITQFSKVRLREAAVLPLNEFLAQQVSYSKSESLIVQQDDGQFKFKPYCSLESADIKKSIWMAIIIVSCFDILTKAVLVPVLLFVPQASQAVSYYNYQGLEIYFTFTTDNKVTYSASDYLLMFLPNSLIIIFSFSVYFLRSVNQKTEVLSLAAPVQLTNFFILLMLFFLIILTCTSRSIIGLVLWGFQLLLLYKMYRDHLVERTYFNLLKGFISTVFIFMYFCSTPIQYFLFQDSTLANESIEFIGIGLLTNFSSNPAEAIVFTIFSLIVFNFTCLIQRNVKTVLLQKSLQPTIERLRFQLEEFHAFVKSQQTLELSPNEFSDIIPQESNEESENKKNSNLTYSEAEAEEEKENGNQNLVECDEEVIGDAPIEKEAELAAEDAGKNNFTQSNMQDEKERNAEGDQDKMGIWERISKAILEQLVQIKRLLDQPIVSLRVLQVLSIAIVILQHTYFSITLLSWIILSGFTTNFKILRIYAIFLSIPALLTNYFTFYYQNIIGMNEPNNIYNFCVNSLGYHQCENLGFFVKPYSVVNTSLMDITICLFFLFLKQVEQYYMAVPEQTELPEAASWTHIFIVYLTKLNFNLVMILVYWVGFYQIDLIQFGFVFILIVSIVNSSRLCKKANGAIVTFSQKYWNILKFYVSFVTFITYLYQLFGQEWQDGNADINSLIQFIGLYQKNSQIILYWILFYITMLQSYAYKSKVFKKYQYVITQSIAQKEFVQKYIPNFTQHVSFLSLINYKFLIWISFGVNICFLLFTPFSYTNAGLLLFVGVIFLTYVQKIMTETNYNRFKVAWDVYLNLLILTFTVRYLFSFSCFQFFNSPAAQNPQLQHDYQQYGLYPYQTSQLRLEYMSDTLNIFFGSLAFYAFTQFALWQKINKGERVDDLLSSAFQHETENAKLLEFNVMDQWKWLKMPAIFFANINTDIITIYIVLSCAFYLRSVAALILLILYLSYFYMVHDKILTELASNQMLLKLVKLILVLKVKYLDLTQCDQNEREILQYYLQIRTLRRNTRIKMKRNIWLVSFYFTAFCIYLTYVSQFMTMYSVSTSGNAGWIKYAATAFFVFGTYAQQTPTEQPYCSTDDNYDQTTSNIWSQCWFYLFLLLVNVVDTSSTKILADHVKQEEIRSYDEFDEMENKFNVNQMSDEQVKEIFEKKYSFVRRIKSDEQQQDFARDSLVINFYRHKEKLIKILLKEATFKVIQRILILLYLINTILVNTIFSLFYLGTAAYMFLEKTSVSNMKRLNRFAIFAIWFQYILYLMNWTPPETSIPKQTELVSLNFSLVYTVGLHNSTWQSYLGFNDTYIMNCGCLQDQNAESYCLFYGENCEENNLLNWVFFFNMVVVSLIYLYFLIIEWLSISVYKSATKMKRNLVLTKRVLQEYNCKLILTYPAWKQKNYTFKQQLLQIITRNFHIFVIALIIFLSAANRIVFNMIELLIAISFVIVTEFFLEWPYLLNHRRLVNKFFLALFFMAVFTIAMFTLMKIPSVLSDCANINYQMVGEQISYDPQVDQIFIFYCMEAFNIRIDGMVFVLFIIALYFDLINSQHYLSKMREYQFKEELRAKMVSLALAYDQTYTEYKEILKIQEQKNIFVRLSEIIEVKLKFWRKKVKQAKENQVVSSVVKEKIEYPKLFESAIETPEQQLEKIKGFKKIEIELILWFKSKTNRYKFMSFTNLLNYILSQNKVLDRMTYVSMESYLQKDAEIYKRQVEFVEKFHTKLRNRLLNKQINVIQNLSELASNVNQQVKKRYKQRIPRIEELDGVEEDENLSFVKIYDEQNRIYFVQTKQRGHLALLFELSTGRLMIVILKEILKYAITYWETFTYLMIILYFAKNSSLLGATLPTIMFVWALIDTYQHKFWAIAYSLFVFIVLIVFGDSLSGLYYQQPDSTNQLWYVPLDDSKNDGLFFEFFLMWMIIFQVFLMKQFGVYYKSVNRIENIFTGYLRMKINNFNQAIVSELVSERSNSSVQDSSPQKLELKQVESSSSAQSELEEKIQLIQSKKCEAEVNDIEKKIFANPKLIDLNYDPGFFQRMFSFEQAKSGQDLYIWIAFIQVFIFIYLLFFFNFMINAQNGINEILSQNQIPGTLVGALIAEMLLMVSERFIVLADSRVAVEEESKDENEKKQESQEQKGANEYQAVHGQSETEKIDPAQSPLITEPNKKQKQKVQSIYALYKTQLVIKYVLQIFILALVFWFIFFHVGQPWYFKNNSQNSFTTNASVIMFFFLFSIYFYLSALQLRYGYRELKIRDQILYVYTTFAYLFAQVYYSTPFLFELKVLMDWTALETSLDIFQWFKLDDIHGKLYFTKYSSTSYVKRQIGLVISWVQKLALGFCLVLLILLCIFGPLILFSSLNPATTNNPITGGELDIYLINVNTSLQVHLYYTNQFYGLENELTTQSEIKSAFNGQMQNPIILNAPNSGGLQQFQVVSFSDGNWQISLPQYELLVSQLENRIQNITQDHFLFNVSYSFTRADSKLTPIPARFSYPYNPKLANTEGHELSQLSYEILIQLYESIANCNSSNIYLENFYIETLQLYQVDGSSYSISPIYGDGANTAMPVNVSLTCTQNSTSPVFGASYWSFTYSGDSEQVDEDAAQGMLFFAVCDTFSPLTYGFSLITIYTSVVIIIGTYIRSTFSGAIKLIEFSGMVNPDDLLMICEAISVARSLRMYEKENMLYFELIDILRSPEIVKVMTGSWQSVIQDQKQTKKLKSD